MRHARTADTLIDMAGSVPKSPATYEDLLRAPEGVVAEIVDGELVTSPRPSIRHAATSTSLQSGLSTAFDRRGGGSPGGWVLLFEPELHLVDQILVPDLAGWRTETLAVLPDAAFIDKAPDWIGEVLSPRTVALDRTCKMHHYARAGVGHLWLLDPQPETLEVYRLAGPTWQLVTSVAGSQKLRAEPFDAVELDLARIWAR